MWILATLPLTWVEPPGWVRVEDPDHPDAIAHSATASMLEAPPTDGTPWRRASFPELDVAPSSGERTPLNEAVEVTNAHLWHADGVTGAGVKVAVFDPAWFGAEGDPTAVGDFETHDCFLSVGCEVPMDVLRPPPTPLGGGNHGWACAEAIRRLAPDAELHLVRVNSLMMLENAVDWAIREDIDIISMSTSYYNGSFYDGGGPHAALMERLEAAGVLMVTSAGNNARQHWLGDFNDADADGRMDGDGDNGLWVFLEAATTLYVNWNQHDRCGDTDLDVAVYDGDRNVMGLSNKVQAWPEDGEICSPTEVFTASAPVADWYRIEVTHQRGTRVGLRVDVLSRGGQLFEPGPGSVTDPGAHPLAVAVGAVNIGQYWDGPAEGFSAIGPNHAGWPKPDIAGPDGYSVDAYGVRGFTGTSASTPAVAGLIALVMSDDPDLTPRGAIERLQGYARPTGAGPGPDPVFGAGKARLPVRDPVGAPCGQRPLIMPLLFWPWFFRLRRARR